MLKSLKCDLRTRVTGKTYERVRVYAAAQELSVYQATERLILQGLEARHAVAKPIDGELRDAVFQLSARIEILSAMADRAVFGAFVNYSYARHAALSGLSDEMRQTRDKALLDAGQEAYQRQLKKILEK